MRDEVLDTCVWGKELTMVIKIGAMGELISSQERRQNTANYQLRGLSGWQNFPKFKGRSKDKIYMYFFRLLLEHFLLKQRLYRHLLSWSALRPWNLQPSSCLCLEIDKGPFHIGSFPHFLPLLNLNLNAPFILLWTVTLLLYWIFHRLTYYFPVNLQGIYRQQKLQTFQNCHRPRPFSVYLATGAKNKKCDLTSWLAWL